MHPYFPYKKMLEMKFLNINLVDIWAPMKHFG